MISQHLPGNFHSPLSHRYPSNLNSFVRLPVSYYQNDNCFDYNKCNLNPEDGAEDFEEKEIKIEMLDERATNLKPSLLSRLKNSATVGMVAGAIVGLPTGGILAIMQKKRGFAAVKLALKWTVSGGLITAWGMATMTMYGSGFR